MILDDPIIRFEQSDGTSCVLEMPSGGESLEDRFAGLKKATRAIAIEWERRSTVEPSAKSKPRYADLERSCYQLIVHCLYRDGLFHDLQHLARKHDYQPRLLVNPINRFAVGLDAIFPKPPKPPKQKLEGTEPKVPPKKPVLRDMQRWRLLAEMWFAFRHYIPPALYNVFVQQAGGGDAIRKENANIRIKDAWMNAIDPTYKSWIVECRVDDTLIGEMRGAYDAEIQRAVRGRRRDLLERRENYERIFNMWGGWQERRRRSREPAALSDPTMSLRGKT